MDYPHIQPNWPAAATHCQSYLAYPNITNFDDHYRLYTEMVDWILANSDSPCENFLWKKIGDCIYIYGKNHTELLLFKLRFGS